jgi:hypothetical protein
MKHRSLEIARKFFDTPGGDLEPSDAIASYYDTPAIVARMIFSLGYAVRRRFSWLLFPIVCAAMMAAEFTKSFDIPAGAAEKTLKQFAAQSGMEVLFSTEAARGVRTNAVKGNLIVQAAVRQMLSGTPLYLVEDNKHGVLRIARDMDPNAQRAAPKMSCARPPKQNLQTCLIIPQKA